MQALAGDGNLAAMAEFVHGQHHGHVQTGGFAKKPPQLFHAAASVFFQMVGGVEVFEGEGDVHEVLLVWGAGALKAGPDRGLKVLLAP